MEVEDDDEILQRLFFKKFGRELPEKKSDDVDLGMDLKDLTEEQDKMDAIPTLAPVNIVKKESIEIPKAVIHVVNQAKTVEFLTPKWMSLDKVDCFSLKQAPSRRKSDFNKMSTKQTSLLRVDIKSPSDDASQNETSVQCSWRLNSEQFIDSIPLIASAKRKSMLKNKHVQNLKERRAVIYNCIKRGEKTIMKKIHSPDQRDWELIQKVMRENIISLNNIMEEFRMIELGRTPMEYTQYFNYKLITKRLIEKIDHIIANQVVNISGKVEPLTEQSVLGEEICGNLSTQSSKSETLHAMQ
jgi:hypothetical protein